MDGKWDPEICLLNHLEWRNNDEKVKEVDELCRLGQIWSRLISLKPYDAQLWFNRGSLLLRLGYTELAIGDFYSCKLLTEEGMNCEVNEPSKSRKIGLAVRTYVRKSLKIPTFSSESEEGIILDEEWTVTEALIVLFEGATRYLIDSLYRLHCYQDAIDLTNELIKRMPTQMENYAKLRMSAEQRLQSFVAQQPHLHGEAALMPTRFGLNRRIAYPWVTDNHFNRSQQNFATIRQEIASQQAPCTIITSQSVIGEGDDISVIATDDIRPGSVPLQDSRMIAAMGATFLGSPICQYCCFPVPLGCSNQTHCSNSCASAAPTNIPSIPRTDPLLEKLFPPIQLLPRMLSIYLDSSDNSTHPYNHPIISRWKPDTRQARYTPFSFDTHIKQPISILQTLGVDIFADSRFNTWIMLDLLNRISSNMLSRTISSSQESKPSAYPTPPGSPTPSIESIDKEITVHSLGYLLPLFNHACNPNVSIEPSPGGTILRARRDIQKGEELCVSYIPFCQDQDVRAARLAQWFDQCRCEMCSPTSINNPHTRTTSICNNKRSFVPKNLCQAVVL